ncbi:MAG: hypothetical protein JW745_09275 [Sedimentisphaerales bacterium]|nr:hypothetical protein [Sedimentisphaerales bacterium]MBN2842465.1 hypothetical protein [Sedimentisphaerales bacterium]
MQCCVKTMHKILIVEGDPASHTEFRKIFSSLASCVRKEDYHAGGEYSEDTLPEFEIDFCTIGLDALEMIRLARTSHEPYKVVFIDTCQPNARDSVSTIEEIWQADKDIQVVIFGDRSDELVSLISKVGISERLLIIKKPFEDIEIYQTAVALSCKWDLIQQARIKKEELEDLVSERTCRLAEMNQKLMFAIEKVQRSEQAKEFFLENISKVVRTPLNSIIVNSNLLTKDGLSQQQQKHMAAIHKNASELMQVMGNILDMAEIESNHITPDIQSIRLSSFLNELKVFELQAHEKHLEFLTVIQEDIPEKLYSDPDMLRQCLAILLDNAIKYTEKGRVIMEVSLERGHIRPYLVFSVQDTGTGISLDQQTDMYEPFTPGNSSSGLGLGLAIARKMASKINGEIKLVRTSGSGTTFVLRVPLTEG